MASETVDGIALLIEEMKSDDTEQVSGCGDVAWISVKNVLVLSLHASL
jgi:hypothetical protein